MMTYLIQDINYEVTYIKSGQVKKLKPGERWKMSPGIKLGQETSMDMSCILATGGPIFGSKFFGSQSHP
jgi:hypothetical protein